MKVNNIDNLDEFFKVIATCTGDVMLVTGQGDCLNLKSQLSRYVALAKVFSDGTIPELEIKATNPEDTTRLVSFMMNK